MNSDDAHAGGGDSRTAALESEDESAATTGESADGAGGAAGDHGLTPAGRYGADAENLRRRAVEALQQGRFDLAEECLRSGDVRLEALVENLRIYQAELEIQNEELRRSERQAEEALARFTTLFTSLPIPELVLDQHGLIVDANPAARDLLDLRDTRSHQYFLARLVHEAQRGDVIQVWERLAERESQALHEVRLHTGSGAGLIADMHIARLPDTEGSRARYVCGVVDRTEQFHQREALLSAYDRLDQSREHYRVLAEFSPEWDYWLGIDGRFIHISPACLEITGYSAAEFLQDSELLERIIHPDDLDAWRRHFDEPREAVQQHAPLQLRIRTRDGNERWIEHVCAPVESEDGRPLGLRGVNRDISVRHAAQEALRSSEALLNATGRLARVGGWELDARTRVLRWTGVTRELHEVEKEYLPDVDSAMDFYHPDDRTTLRAALEAALAQGEPYELDLRLRTARGRKLWVKTTGAPVFGERGIHGLRGSIQDITERVEAERALRDSEARFRSVFDAAPLAIAVVDEAGRPVMTNPALQRWLGYSAEELQRMTFADYTHPGDMEDDHARYLELVEGRAQSYTRDKRYIRKDGSEAWGRLTVALIRDDAGAPRYAVGMIADIGKQRAAEHALRESERKYRALFESAVEGMWIIQGDRYVSVNHTALRLLGHEDPDAVLQKRPYDLSPPEQPDGEPSEQKQSRILKRAYAGRSQRFEWEHLRADGSTLPVEVTLIPVELGGEPSLFVTWHDLTEKRAAEKREEQARTVFDNTSEGIIITDPEQRILAVNRAFTEITGYSEAEALGRRPTILKSGRQDETFYQTMWAALNTAGQWRGEFWNRRKNGEIYPQLSTISAVRDQSGRLTNYIAVFGDITQRKQSEQALYDLAHHDALTGLPNRALLRARLDQSLRRAQRDQTMLALLFLDLDLFKNVNDTLGHSVGDALLQRVADAMAAKIRGADSIARLGGDEFIVLTEDLPEPNVAAQLARRLLAVFAEPFDAMGRELYITASIGISVYPMDGGDMDTLLSNADVAMYQAKEHGRNTYRFFEPAMTEGAIERLQLENALRGALVRGELDLSYQPQMRLSDGCMLGAEVLLRWTHPELGEIEPDRFIRIAEEIGIINELGLWVLEQACRQLKEWEPHGLRLPRMAVNLSVQQLERPELVDRIGEILSRYEITPSRMELEVTESMLMRHADQVIANLSALRGLGITIAVDDFGSGFSSLAYLKQLPINRLKIDKVFIDQLNHDSDDDAIARAVIALAKGLGLAVLAEGVETREQLDFLLEEGCGEAQGFLFGRPMSAGELLDRHKKADKACTEG